MKIPSRFPLRINTLAILAGIVLLPSLGAADPPPVRGGAVTSLRDRPGIDPTGTGDSTEGIQKVLDLGTSVFFPNGKYLVNRTLTVPSGGVELYGSGPGVTIRRGATLNAPLINVTGPDVIVHDLQIDGNGLENTGNHFAELVMGGDRGVVQRLTVVNSRARSISLKGSRSRATQNTIIGIGSPSLQTYGIWAINHVPVTIDHNTITGCGIDGIGADGIGTVIDSNVLSGNHAYTAMGGGQIATYSGPFATDITVSNNTVNAGAAPVSSGLEINSSFTTVFGNIISNQQYNGVVTDASASHIWIRYNRISGSGRAAAAPGIRINPESTFIFIGENSITDDPSHPTQTYGVEISRPSPDNCVLGNNEISGNKLGTVLYKK